jgi:hypothetical protein
MSTQERVTIRFTKPVEIWDHSDGSTPAAPSATFAVGDVVEGRLSPRGRFLCKLASGREAELPVDDFLEVLARHTLEDRSQREARERATPPDGKLLDPLAALDPQVRAFIESRTGPLRGAAYVTLEDLERAGIRPGPLPPDLASYKRTKDLASAFVALAMLRSQIESEEEVNLRAVTLVATRGDTSEEFLDAIRALQEIARQTRATRLSIVNLQIDKVQRELAKYGGSI